MSDKAEKFVNDKLGDKNYTHSPYPIHREELVQWLDEFTNQWHEEFDLFKENQRLKDGLKEIQELIFDENYSIAEVRIDKLLNESPAN